MTFGFHNCHFYYIIYCLSLKLALIFSFLTLVYFMVIFYRVQQQKFSRRQMSKEMAIQFVSDFCLWDYLKTLAIL